MAKQKIFCIGLPKTGTKSIALSLELLGYHVTGPNRDASKALKKEISIT